MQVALKDQRFNKFIPRRNQKNSFLHYECIMKQKRDEKGRKIYQKGNMDWFNFKFSNLNYVKCVANSAENSCFDLMSERVKS